MEMVNNIVREMRTLARIDEESDEKIARKHMSLALSAYASRIEAAVKALEADRDNWRRQALAEDARANEAQSVTNCNRQKDWRKICAACQEGEPPEDCEFYGEPDGCNARPRCVHPTCKESLQVGNAAKMREALEELIANIEMRSSTFGLNVMVDTKPFLDAKAALSAPARNCDRFSNNEQAWDAYCEYMSDSNVMFLDYEEWLFAEAKGESENA